VLSGSAPSTVLLSRIKDYALCFVRDLLQHALPDAGIVLKARKKLQERKLLS
jgi:hypothetical protein